MGYNQNHAGLHLIPHGYSGLQNEKEYDKYSEMIAETSLIRQEMRKFESHPTGSSEPYIPVIQSHFQGSIT